MGPLFSLLVLVVTITAAFMVGVAVSKQLVSGILHFMMLGRLKHKQPSVAVAVPAAAAATAQLR